MLHDLYPFFSSSQFPLSFSSFPFPFLFPFVPKLHAMCLLSGPQSHQTEGGLRCHNDPFKASRDLSRNTRYTALSEISQESSGAKHGREADCRASMECFATALLATTGALISQGPACLSNCLNSEPLLCAQRSFHFCWAAFSNLLP